MFDTSHQQVARSASAVPRRSTSEIDLVNTAAASDLLRGIRSHIDVGRGFAVATMNLDHVVKLRTRPEFLAAYRQHTYVVADGHPVVWLRRIARAPVELVTGADLIEPLMAMAARQGTPVAFLGATEETLSAAAEILKRRHPGLKIVACIAPPFGLDPEGPEAAAALHALADSGARLCLLSLGSPKQELLAARGLAMVPWCGFVSIGAGLDFIAGQQRRAPLWMRRLALEWLWRVLNNPRRLAARYLACFRVLPAVVWQALMLRLGRAGAGAR
jgi:N-acetylglucosaminyldiphosphoundecaprenol N-acetyl-beta-D-mannosaminyltransferase